MTRDSAETGDPDTLQGQFPSEIEGAGGGGGGGGQSSPTFINPISKPMGGRGNPAQVNLRKALAWDSRPLGGTRYGVYIPDERDPFKQGGNSYTSTTFTDADTTLTGSASISSDFVIGPDLFITGYPTAVTSAVSLRLLHSVTYSGSLGPFTTFSERVMTSVEHAFMGPFPTGTTFAIGTGAGMVVPAPYIYQGHTYSQFNNLAPAPTAADGQQAKNFLGAPSPWKRQILTVPNTVTFNVSLSLGFNPGTTAPDFLANQVGLVFYGFNQSSIDNDWSAVSY